MQDLHKREADSKAKTEAKSSTVSITLASSLWVVRAHGDYSEQNKGDEIGGMMWDWRGIQRAATPLFNMYQFRGMRNQGECGAWWYRRDMVWGDVGILIHNCLYVIYLLNFFNYSLVTANLLNLNKKIGLKFWAGVYKIFKIGIWRPLNHSPIFSFII